MPDSAATQRYLQLQSKLEQVKSAHARLQGEAETVRKQLEEVEEQIAALGVTPSDLQGKQQALADEIKQLEAQFATALQEAQAILIEIKGKV